MEMHEDVWQRGVERFFAYARERHSIYLRRQRGVPRSDWTSDPILQKYRFTNVFREIDATTVWFRENVRKHLSSSPDVLLATVLFRWFNRIRTGEAIFSQTRLDTETPGATAWDELVGSSSTEVVRSSVLQYCGGGPYVTGAYIIKTPDGLDKLSGVLRCVEWFMTQSQKVGEGRFGDALLDQGEMSRMLSREPGRHSLEFVWDWLRRFPYMGDFMAYEVVTDLRHTDLLYDAPDIMTWANPGPGATRGAGRVVSGYHEVFRKSSRDRQEVMSVMSKLLSLSRKPEYWPQEDRESWSVWEMRDVEHTLCEFDKYERVRLGQGRPRGVYR